MTQRSVVVRLKRHCNSKRKCQRKADARLYQGLYTKESKVKKLYESWLNEIKVTTSRGYWGNYEGYWKNWIEKELGYLRIEEVTEQHFQNIINAAYIKGLSKKTLQNMRACMAAFMKYCRKCGVTTLAIENVTIPKRAKVGKRTILQPDDLQKLFTIDTTLFKNRVAYEPLVYAFRFQVSTGLRPGELIGLKWDDIDLESGYITLQRSVNKFHEVTTGKNDNARRVFILTTLSKSILTEHMKNNKACCEFVFPLNQKVLKTQTYYDRWVKYRAHAGITDATPYELRHTFISIIKRLPEGLIKPLVGHSVNMNTYSVYGHEIDGELMQVSELIQAVFDNIGVKYC